MGHMLRHMLKYVPDRHAAEYELKHVPQHVLKHVPKHVLMHTLDRHMLAKHMLCLSTAIF